MMISWENVVSTAVLIFNVQNITDISEVIITNRSSQYYFKNSTLTDVQPYRIAKKSFSNFFSKCCPPGYTYDMDDRKCVQTNDTLSIYDELNIDVGIIKHSLTACDVIVDRLITNISVIPQKTDALILDNEVFPSGKYCLDKINKSSNYVARTCYESEYCLRGNDEGRKPWCLKKCCPDGYAFSKDGCNLHPEIGIDVRGNPNIFQETENYALFNHEGDCRQNNGIGYNYSVSGNGVFMLLVADGWKEYNVSELAYCVESDLSDGSPTLMLLLCAEKNENNMKFLLIKTALILSCIFLLITGLVYIFVHKLKRTIHKITLCFCVFEAIAFALLFTTLGDKNVGEHCKPIGFAFHYVFLVSFAWLNVMCYDIWHVLGSIKGRAWQNKIEIIKTMACYTTYSLLVPLIFTLLFYMANNKIFTVPDSIFPHLGESRCLLENRLHEANYAHILYFLLPTGILISINLVFFVKTIWYFIQVKKNLKKIGRSSISERKKKLKIDQEKFMMILKLILLMGITWIFEIISSVVNFKKHTITKYIELVFDSVDSLQGVFVFLILVVKWRYIKRKLLKFLDIRVEQTSSTSTKSFSNSTNSITQKEVEMSNLDNNK